MPESGTGGDMASSFYRNLHKQGQTCGILSDLVSKKKKKKTQNSNKVFNTYLKYSGDLTVGNDMEMELIPKKYPVFPKADPCASERF